jgi:rRNA maturation endonuclease Nob1
MFGGGEFARCGGIYESATIICPSCGGEITFSKEELEVQP